MQKKKPNTKENKFRISPHVHIEHFEDGALALSLERRKVFQLNLTAGCILQHTDGKNTVTEIAKALANQFKIEEEDALDDVIELYEQLNAMEWIESCD